MSPRRAARRSYGVLGHPRRSQITIGLRLVGHTALYDPGEFNIDIFQFSNVDMAFAESRTARHSQDSRDPLHAGDDFRGLQVQFAGKASPRRFFLFLACYPPFIAALCRGAAYNVGMADYLIARCPSRPGLPPHSHRAPATVL